MNRRDFVRLSATASGGLLISVALPNLACGGDGPGVRPEGFKPNAWVRIESNGDVIILSHKSEMGQGVWTALPMILAEELDADWERVRIERAPAVQDFHTETGGSSSVRDSWETLRKAGAVARAALVRAAAHEWGVSESECTTDKGVVIHPSDGRRTNYGALTSAAAAQPIPEPDSVTLKDARKFRIVGTNLPRRDLVQKVTGDAMFGVDVKLPGMLVACVARCPAYTGRVARIDDRKARAMPGVRHIVKLDPVPSYLPGRVAVLADDTWSAMQGCRALEVEWDFGPNGSYSSEQMWREARAAVDADDRAQLCAKQGDDSRPPAGAKRVEATYEVPFLAHACMEPMNCTAHVTSDHVDIWVPTQFPRSSRKKAAQLTGMPEERVDVHVTFLGGGFGRRAYEDFVIEAVELAKHVGVPVKVMWTREDDIQHDFYRPATLQRFQAWLDSSGRPIQWHNRSVSLSQERWWFPTTTRPQERDPGDPPPYNLPNYLIDFVEILGPVPLGAWRAVKHSQNGFCLESFVDECAAAAGKDPLEYRLWLLEGRPRQQAVLRLAAEQAQWREPLAKRRGRGVAFWDYAGTYVAQVAEVTVNESGAVQVDRVVCAFDCGTMVNPDTVRAQIESAVIWGVSAALWGEITVSDGRTHQSNFHDYRVLKLADSPRIEVHLVRNFEPPSGVGEPAVPPVAPAVANAVFAATGHRPRRLPLNGPT